MIPGFYPCSELTNEEYHRSPGVSNSGLKVLGERSPAHYKGGRFEETRAKFIGTALHASVLEPERFAAEYVVAHEFSDRRTSNYKAWAKVQTRNILMPEEAENIEGMHASLFSHHSAGALLRDAHEFELSAYANDPDTGVLVRIRMDLFTRGAWIVDVKKCQDASPRGARKQIENYGYAHQAALYTDCFEWASGEAPAGFAFLFVEEQPPHAVGVYVIHPHDMTRARELYRRNLRKYANCLKRDKWPAYSEEIEYIEFSPYERRRIDSLVIEG